MHALDKETVRALESGQVITDTEAIVKELVENSLDAHAKTINVKLLHHGLELIQVQDDGQGISVQDRPHMAQRHWTSKLTSFDGLQSICTFGFRGEALHSICAVAKQISITTKTTRDTTAKCYVCHSTGDIQSERIASTIATSGAIVSVHQPFYHLPVRKQMAQKNKDAIAKRIQEWIIYIALSHPSVRFSFLSLHNSVAGREKTWIKPASSHLLENITMVYGKRLTDMLRVHSIVDVSTKGCDEDTLTITCVLPLASAEPAVVYKGDKVFIYCNARPIKYAKSELKEVVNMIRKRYKEVSGLAYDTKLQTPFMYVDIQTNPNQYDVNIEPNKTAVLFHDQPRIIKLIEALLNECYKVPEQQAPYDMSSYQQKVDTQKDRIITQAPEDSSFTSKIENDEQVVDNTPLQNSPWEFSMLSTISYDSDDSVDELESEPGIELNAMEPNHRVPTLLDWLKGTPVDRKTSHSIIEIQKAPQLIKIGAHQTRETSVPLPEEDWDIGPPQQEPDTPQSYVMSLTMLPEKKDNEKSTKADLPSTQTLKDQMKRNRSNDSREDGMKCSLGALEGLESKRSKLQDSFPNFSVVPPSRDTTTPDTPSRPPLISTTRHRAISSLVGEPVLRSTLHSSKTLGSKRVLHWDYDSVKACYPHRRQRVAHFRQLGLNDYPNISFNKRIENGAMSTPTGSLVHCTPLNSKDLAFYVMYQEVPGMGQYVEQLGVIDLQRAHIIKKFKYLMENCRVVGKTLLDEPVSLEQSQQDPLYSVLLGLEGYEHQVTDNEQSNLPAQYTVITDKRVVNNGFCAQWYKECHGGKIIVNITAVYDTVSDDTHEEWHELLQNIFNQPYSSFQDLRPKSLVLYLYQMACKDHSYSSDTPSSFLQEALHRLVWRDSIGQQPITSSLSPTTAYCLFNAK